MFNRIIVYFIITFGLSSCGVSCMSTLTAFPSTGESVAPGDDAWSNPGDIIADDSTNAFVTLDPNDVSEYLYATGFLFAHPDGAVMVGLKAEIEANTGDPNIIFSEVVMLKAGSIVTGTNQAASDSLATILTVYSFGGEKNLWSTTVNASELEATGFGMAFRVTRTGGFGFVSVTVDYVKLTAYFESLGGLCTSQIIRAGLRTTTRVSN